MYQSNYFAGLRVLDIHDPVNPQEVAYFDTTPGGVNYAQGGSGSWDNYPFFKNGVNAVSSYGEKGDAGRGVFLLRYRPGTTQSP